MDPILLLVLAIFIVLVVVALVTRNRNLQDGNTPTNDEVQTETYEFEEDTEGITPTVRRRSRFVVPPQKVNGVFRKIVLTPQPLPQVDALVLPPEKGIEALDVLVINPTAQVADTAQEIFEFDPPLTITINYNKQDAASAQLNQNGQPAMSIISGYESANGWRFERLPTTVAPDPETGGGTLTAQLSTLHPKDPLWAGRP